MNDASKAASAAAITSFFANPSSLPGLAASGALAGDKSSASNSSPFQGSFDASGFVVNVGSGTAKSSGSSGSMLGGAQPGTVYPGNLGGMALDAGFGLGSVNLPSGSGISPILVIGGILLIALIAKKRGA